MSSLLKLNLLRKRWQERRRERRGRCTSERGVNRLGGLFCARSGVLPVPLSRFQTSQIATLVVFDNAHLNSNSSPNDLCRNFPEEYDHVAIDERWSSSPRIVVYEHQVPCMFLSLQELAIYSDRQEVEAG